jgi:hypothetical protein
MQFGACCHGMCLAFLDLGELQEVKAVLLGVFRYRDLGAVTRFLNITIWRDRASMQLELSQPIHVKELLEHMRLVACPGKLCPFHQVQSCQLTMSVWASCLMSSTSMCLPVLWQTVLHQQLHLP